MIFRAVQILCMMLGWSIHVHLFKAIECNNKVIYDAEGEMELDEAKEKF